MVQLLMAGWSEWVGEWDESLTDYKIVNLRKIVSIGCVCIVILGDKDAAVAREHAQSTLAVVALKIKTGRIQLFFIFRCGLLRFS